MNQKKIIVSILAGLLAAIMVLTLIVGLLPTAASAASSSELKNQLNELEKDKNAVAQKIKDLQGKLNQNASELKELSAQKDVIDQQIALMHQQISNINSQISTYNLMIADKQDELVSAQNKLKELNTQYKERIRTMEEQGPLSYWSVLFKARSFSDLLDRISMILEIAAADQRRLSDIRKAAREVEDAKNELNSQKLALEKSKSELEDTQNILSARRGEADQLLIDMKAKGDEFSAMMDKAEADEQALMQQIADKEKEYDKAKHQEWLATSVPPTGAAASGNVVNGITWVFPIKYYSYVSSAFGPRPQPTAGASTYHQGVDLASPSGTPIYATRSGRVTIAEWGPTAGNYVGINHGDGFSSVYMHMTHFVVKTGQYVEAGQIIGYCGSTGASTGPHLHFGIAYNGKYINPAKYIGL